MMRSYRHTLGRVNSTRIIESVRFFPFCLSSLMACGYFWTVFAFPDAKIVGSSFVLNTPGSYELRIRTPVMPRSGNRQNFSARRKPEIHHCSCYIFTLLLLTISLTYISPKRLICSSSTLSHTFDRQLKEIIIPLVFIFHPYLPTTSRIRSGRFHLASAPFCVSSV